MTRITDEMVDAALAEAARWGVSTYAAPMRAALEAALTIGTGADVMLDARIVRAAMRYDPDRLEPWVVEAFDASGNIIQTWTRGTRPNGLLANVERHLKRRNEGEQAVARGEMSKTETEIRAVWARVRRDSPALPPLQAAALVARLTGHSPLMVGVAVGLRRISEGQ